MYYKVVGWKMQSLVVRFNRFTVTYKLNEWVEPAIPESRLMVFDSLKHAVDFCRTNPGHIYSCEIEDPEPMDVVCVAVNEWLLSRFWAERKRFYTKLAPKGTIGAKRVKLLERIPDHVL